MKRKGCIRLISRCTVSFLTFAILLLSLSANAQVFRKANINEKYIFGLHSSGQGYNFKDPVTKDITKESYVFLEPYLGYFFNKNFGLGPILGYQRFRSTFDEGYDLFEFGGFARYYIPIGLNPDWSVSMLFLSELSYRRANYVQVSSSEVIPSSSFNENIFTFTPIGAQIKIWNGFFGEISTEWIIFPAEYDRFGYRIGLEYHTGYGKGKR